MHTHLLTPLAPLVLRIGKPFGETGGGESHPFPLPSTVAGAMRTAHADALELDFNTSISRILGWHCHGALPASLSNTGVHPLFPRPADARYISTTGFIVRRLEPIVTGGNEGCDLPDGLTPVHLTEPDKAKPANGPNWWNEETMRLWLMGKAPDPGKIGPPNLPIETRTHVALNPSTLAASDGQLFQSAGPDFEAHRLPSNQFLNRRGWSHLRYALLVRFSECVAQSLMRLGGEARLVDITSSDAWPILPPVLATKLQASKCIRIILATPALFTNGWKPGWLGPNLTGSPPGMPGLTLCLKAVAIERWQPISGWDLKANKPKAVRRLVPSGSVYWFEVIEAQDGWAEELWLKPISDNVQERQDGFGLALPGIWK